MPVSSNEVQTLKNIKGFLEAEIQKEEKGNDVRGIYDKVVEKLTGYNSIGRNIELDWRGMFDWTNGSFKFTEEQIREVAKRKFARYCFYTLGENIPENVPRKIKQNLERLAQNKAELRENLKRILSPSQYVYFSDNPFIDWFSSLDSVTIEVLNHYGTLLEETE